MFCVTWLVTASSITEPIADSASQVSCVRAAGGATAACARPSAGTGSPSVAAAARIDAHPVAAQTPANTTYSADQPQPSCARSNHGSSRIGKPSSASSDAKLDSANSRYGTALRKRRQYQDCNSGVVVDSRKYGRPIVAVSSSRMRSVGSSSPCGFQLVEARIGSDSSDTASSTMCSVVWRRTPSRVVQSA